jgi:hypothetical protein
MPRLQEIVVPVTTASIMAATSLISKKERLSTGKYCMPRRQEITTANKKGPHAVSEQKQNENIPMSWLPT